MQRIATILEKMGKQQAVQVVEHQPLGPAGRPGPQSLIVN